MTVNSYDQLLNDPDIGPNRDAEYVTGTGAFDQIFIKKLNATQASVTVNAYDDNSYTNLIGTFSYKIRLTKLVSPGRLASNQPFHIVVVGCTGDDQIFLDPTLGVQVNVHGGPEVKTLNITGNGAYNLQFTPAAPASPLDFLANARSLIPENLLPGGGGTLKITGATNSSTRVKVGNQFVTRTVATPFTTTVVIDHFNAANESAIRLDNYNKLSYVAPGFLDTDSTVTSLADGSWNIAGQVQSGFFPPALSGNLQITNIKQLVLDTSHGGSNDTISFITGASTPTGLQSVNILEGTGIDALNFDDSASAQNLNYVVSPSLILPGQPGNSGFTGYVYSGVESLNLVGTGGNNAFVVTPSKATFYNIDGSDPADVTLPGDSLAIRTVGTTGATLDVDPSTGTDGTWTFTSGHRPISFTNIEQIIQPTHSILAVAGGAGVNGKPLVKVYDAVTKTLLYSFYAYAQAFTGGVQVAVADVNNDGVLDVITAPGAGVVPINGADLIKVWDGATLEAAGGATLQHFVADPSSALLDTIMPEAAAYKNGLFVAAGDVNGDGTVDIVASRGTGAPMVRVFASSIASGTISDASNTGPITITVDSTVGLQEGDRVVIKNVAGNTAANGTWTISNVTANSFDLDGSFGSDTFVDDGLATWSVAVPVYTASTAFGPYSAAQRVSTGSPIAVGDVDGDGVAEIITVPGSGQPALVRIFDGFGNFIRQFNGFEPTFRNGVSIAAGDLDGDGKAEIILGAGTGGASRVRILNASFGTLEKQFQAYTTGNINAPVKIAAVDPDNAGIAQLYTVQGAPATTHEIRLFDPLAGDLIDHLIETSIDLRGGINMA